VARPDLVASHGVGEAATTGRLGSLADRSRPVGLASSWCAVAKALLDEQDATLGRQPDDGVAPDEVGTAGVAERSLDGGPEWRVDLERLVDPATADAAGGAGDPARRLLRQPRLERVDASDEGRTAFRRRPGQLGGGALRSLTGVEGGP
jgi:hypothetical protein